MADADQPVLLLSTWSDTEAELVRQLLESHGIRCSVSSQVPHSVLPLTVDGLGEIRLHVAPGALEEARRIVDAYREGGEGAARSGAGRARGQGDAAGRAGRATGVVVPMPVTVRAATRVDLAGGTVDIWPLHLYLDHPVTVNAAIDLHAVAEASALDGRRVDLRSDDQGAAAEVEDVDDLDVTGALPLLARLVRQFAPEGGVRLRTAASVPAGSGLGGSSALAVAGAVALWRLGGEPAAGLEAEPLARLLSGLEAQVLGIPTGVQDYYPALLGGVLALEFSPAGVRAEALAVDAAALERRLVLVYEGESRSSATANWDMVRRFLDGDRQTRSALADVARAARELADGLRRGDLDAAGEAMAAEMAARRRLSPAVMTPATERLFAAASRAGALGAKVCGAGGGGCSLYWARHGRREALARELEAAGGRVLPFRIAPEGLLAGAAGRAGASAG